MVLGGRGFSRNIPNPREIRRFGPWGERPLEAEAIYEISCPHRALPQDHLLAGSHRGTAGGDFSGSAPALAAILRTGRDRRRTSATAPALDQLTVHFGTL